MKVLSVPVSGEPYVAGVLFGLPDGSAIPFTNTRKPDDNEHSNHRGNSSPTSRA